MAWLQNKLAILGGGDPRRPNDPDNRVRHTATGLLLLAVGAWAFFATTATFYENLQLPLPGAALVGALVATVVLTVDILITSSPLTSDSPWAKLKVVLTRGLISLTIGIVISHTTILFMYRDALEKIVSDKNAAESAQIVETTTQNSKWNATISDANSRIAEYNQQIAAADQTLADAQARLDDLKKQWSDDEICVNGDYAANGDRCTRGETAQTLLEAYENYRDIVFPPIQTNHDSVVKSLTADRDSQNKILNDAIAAKAAEVASATQATSENTGLAAQTTALVTLLKEDPFVWIWPAFFIALDLVVALMKAILPESDFDRTRRVKRALNVKEDRALSQIVYTPEARDEAARIYSARLIQRAKYLVANSESDQQSFRPRSNSGSRPRIATASTLVVLAVVGVAVFRSASGHPDDRYPLMSTSGQNLTLATSMNLFVPPGAISDNATVVATVAPQVDWVNHQPISTPVTLDTAGQIIDGSDLNLSLQLSDEQAAAAEQGLLQLAYQSDDPDHWTEYPSTYDPQTKTVSASLEHFSTWQFWEWDWPSLLGTFSQTVGEWAGRRSSETPQCDTQNLPTPEWYRSSAGSESQPALVIRSCMQGHEGDDVLDVQIVNNRPYGMVLYYNGAQVQYGWHEEPKSLSEAFRNAIGDWSVRNVGLYLPPLSRAAVGIAHLDPGQGHEFPILPSSATMTADLLAIVTDHGLDLPVNMAANKWVADMFAQAAAKDCAKILGGTAAAGVPDRSTIYNVLTEGGAQCIKGILTVAARDVMASTGGIVNYDVVSLSKKIKLTEGLVKATRWGELVNKLGNFFDFIVDANVASYGNVIFGFTVWAKNQVEAPATTEPLSRASSTSPSEESLAPAPVTARSSSESSSSSLALSSTSAIPEPIAESTSGQSPLAIDTSTQSQSEFGTTTSSTPSPTPAPRRVVAFDNYGPAMGPGTPICSGNPGRPESMPGGTVEQEFAVGPGIGLIDTATVQIDPNPDVTVTARLFVDGRLEATTSSVASGDTLFNFQSVPVGAGARVRLSLTWSAAGGKLNTIYTTGSPVDSRLSVQNSCSDGAPSWQKSDVGLRATVGGLSA
ncbi:DUF4407 domain-containing protein [Nakamurella multipartita]|uniref:DUF4407 domain-containing protein n=1 Tax=Nakamurella multipartita (strain ATCC 700099 / DSM 44233 / CIP 104796 / JCM 9543 / NBRC 105858 / Y-104) TaxID=479431 RepID=C8XHC3_NAKMY|nr:DUF4407 domain-containing protein [Nakamurella multipartita]ACV78329.1 hypothetical protein Namu_1940 [Nakamurella multipartita DSM 44233]